MKPLLNADLGEWESPELRQAAFECIDLANLACGGHAGSLEILRDCRQWTDHYGVLTGAHPGLAEAQGRGDAHPSLHEFQRLLDTQLATYLKAGLRLHHIKLHGCLYHLSEKDARIRSALIECCQELSCALICLAGGRVHQEAEKAGLDVWPEAFLDRNYLANGSLVPRSDARALLSGSQEILGRVQALAEARPICALDGSQLNLQARTLCVHADSPSSLESIRLARRVLG